MRYLGWSHVYEGRTNGLHKVGENLLAQDFISIGDLFTKDYMSFDYNMHTETFLSDSSDECYSPDKHSNGFDLSDLSAHDLYYAEHTLLNIPEVNALFAQ